MEGRGCKLVMMMSEGRSGGALLVCAVEPVGAYVICSFGLRPGLFDDVQVCFGGFDASHLPFFAVVLFFVIIKNCTFALFLN